MLCQFKDLRRTFLSLRALYRTARKAGSITASRIRKSMVWLRAGSGNPTRAFSFYSQKRKVWTRHDERAAPPLKPLLLKSLLRLPLSKRGAAI